MSTKKYAALRGAIRAKFGTQEAFAAVIGMRVSSLSAKLNDRSEWTRSQMKLACEALGIPIEDAPAYFFAD